MAVETNRYLTNHPYRLVTEVDIQPGAEMIMVQLGQGGRIPDPKTGRVVDLADPRMANTTIRIDCVRLEPEKEFEDPKGRPFTVPAMWVVYYHCIDPFYNFQCFVPKEDFLDPSGGSIYLVSLRVPALA